MTFVDLLAQRIVTPVAEHAGGEQLVKAVDQAKGEPVCNDTNVLAADAGQPEAPMATSTERAAPPRT